MSDKTEEKFDESGFDGFSDEELEEEFEEEREEDESENTGAENERGKYKFYDKDDYANECWPRPTEKERKQYEITLKNEAVNYAMTGDERSYNEIQKCLHMLIRYIYYTRKKKNDNPIPVNAFHDIYTDCMIKLPKKYDPEICDSFIAYFRNYLEWEITGKKSKRKKAREKDYEYSVIVENADGETEDLYEIIGSEELTPEEEYCRRELTDTRMYHLFKHHNEIRKSVNAVSDRKVLESIYNTMFFTSQIVVSIRESVEWGYYFINHDKEIFRCLDDMLLEFTYRTAPGSLSEIEVNELKSNKEALGMSEIAEAVDIVKKKPDEPLKIPFKHYLFCEYLFRIKDVNKNGKPVTIQAVSQRYTKWKDILKDVVKIEE